jgi:enamine deaminase RidA (YjgF/YER057c/UK114 family)
MVPAVSAAFLLGAVAVAALPVQSGRSFLNLEGKAKPNGYTHVVTTPPGRMVFISGQGGSAPDGSMPADFTSQAENTFRNIGRCLERAGAKFEDVVKVNYFVTDLANTEELRRVRARFLNMAAPPAATLVQAGLSKGLLLEVEGIAVIPERRP